jgi:hypothetical protein
MAGPYLPSVALSTRCQVLCQLGPRLDLAPLPLASGQLLTHYEILGPLGAGGMGEVYRARDTRLERQVAIKVLPEELAHDDERLRRFEREAKTLASLNHPNVAGIHGLDQVDDVCFLALELVPGQDLSERLKRGALPVDEALDVCRQIAEGLEAAHEAGVVHRDLKPANVRLTPEGVAKVLDFGLAKPIRPKPSREGTSTAESDSFLVTEEGLVLGTPTYMSPEQARGKPVDRRTDIWAFGCVLFECLTGKRAFGGDTFTDIVAAIAGQEPDWDALPPLAPRVEELLRRCLTKDPRARLRDAGEARVQLQLALDAPGRGAASAAPSSAPVEEAKRKRSTALLAGALGLAAGGALVYGLRSTRSDATEVSTVSPPLHVVFEELSSGSFAVDIAISPDGASVAWTQMDGIHVRNLGSLAGALLVESGVGEGKRPEDAPICVTWSPDGRELAYIADDVLWRVPVGGGPSMRVADAASAPKSPGAVFWTLDDELVFKGKDGLTVVAVPARGGEVVTRLEVDPKTTQHFDGVAALPDGSLLVVPHRVGLTHADVISLARNGELRDLVQLPGWETGGIGYGAGQIVVERKADGESSLWTIGFSLERGEILGEPTLLMATASPFSISADGTLAYLKREGKLAVEPVWVNERGVIEPFGRKLEGEFLLSVPSHDGRRVITTAPGVGSTIWAHDLDRGVTTAVLKSEEQVVVVAGTLPDGRILGWTLEDVTVAFPLDGQGEPEEITKGALASVSRDGKLGLLLFGANGGDQRLEVLHLADGAVTPFRALKVDEPMLPSISPDGRFALYGANTAGDMQAHLAPFPSGNGDWQVSTDGADFAWFNGKGDTIYLARGGVPLGGPIEVWSVTFQSEPEVRLGIPEPLFVLEGEEVTLTGYHPTEERFLGFRRVPSGHSSIAIHAGWAKPR